MYESIFEDLGLDANLKIGTIRYNQKSFRFKTEVTLNNPAPTAPTSTSTTSTTSSTPTSASTSAHQEWIRHCHKFDFKPSDFGKTFKNKLGETLKIVGIKPKNPKNAILVDVVSENTKKQNIHRKCPPEYVLSKLNEQVVTKHTCTVCKKEIDKTEWFPGCQKHAICKTNKDVY